MSNLQGTEYYEPPPLVAAASEMDDPTFTKHFNLRHCNDGAIPERSSYPDEIATFRAFHRRLHDGVVPPKTVIFHEHDTSDPAQAWQDGTGRQSLCRTMTARQDGQ